MSERRRLVAMIVLFLVGFGLIGLASAVSSSWPLLLTPLPYAAIPWLVVRADVDPG
ncbi:MAG TPA: hypothetical protein VE669_07390 [Actinomycetota bacterium]|nr:hypothetical protein [Actinomycetota bacterium]